MTEALIALAAAIGQLALGAAAIRYTRAVKEEHTRRLDDHEGRIVVLEHKKAA